MKESLFISEKQSAGGRSPVFLYTSAERLLCSKNMVAVVKVVQSAAATMNRIPRVVCEVVDYAATSSLDRIEDRGLERKDAG